MFQCCAKSPGTCFYVSWMIHLITAAKFSFKTSFSDIAPRWNVSEADTCYSKSLKNYSNISCPELRKHLKLTHQFLHMCLWQFTPSVPFPISNTSHFPLYYTNISQWPEIYCNFLFRTVTGTLAYQSSFYHLLHKTRWRYSFTRSILLRTFTYLFTFLYCKPSHWLV